MALRAEDPTASKIAGSGARCRCPSAEQHHAAHRAGRRVRARHLHRRPRSRTPRPRSSTGPPRPRRTCSVSSTAGAGIDPIRGRRARLRRLRQGGHQGDRTDQAKASAADPLVWPKEAGAPKLLQELVDQLALGDRRARRPWSSHWSNAQKPAGSNAADMSRRVPLWLALPAVGRAAAVPGLPDGIPDRAGHHEFLAGPSVPQLLRRRQLPPRRSPRRRSSRRCGGPRCSPWWRPRRPPLLGLAARRAAAGPGDPLRRRRRAAVAAVGDRPGAHRGGVETAAGPGRRRLRASVLRDRARRVQSAGLRCRRLSGDPAASTSGSGRRSPC